MIKKNDYEDKNNVFELFINSLFRNKFVIYHKNVLYNIIKN